MIDENSAKQQKQEENVVVNNKTRYEANYFAEAGEGAPAQGQSSYYKGGAVFLENGVSFTMNGGTIENKSNIFGGAIFIGCGATFTMRSGMITGCSATYGGAIYVAAGGTCNILGGTISGNTANYGPSIYAEVDAVVNIDDSVIIDENSIQIETNVTISTDTILVGKASLGFSLHYVDFGSFPQWYVGNSMNETLESWFGTSSPTSINTYALNSRTWNAYEYTDGNIYVRGTSLPYNTSYTYKNGDTIKASTEIAWFKVEPIRWIILNYDAYINETAENLEIMSYLGLAGDIYFNASNSSSNEWNSSHIRSWVNGVFYNTAFTDAEKRVIAKTTIGNNTTGNYNTQTSNTTGVATEDYVYLLSYWDYYDFDGLFERSLQKRYFSPTDFTLSNNCYVTTGSSYVTATYPSGKTCNFWTRSSGSSSRYVCYVGDNGYLVYSGVQDMKNFAVLPVIQLAI